MEDLPEHIKHHILNFLEEEDVCRAALLSKEWRSAVQSHPVLSFTGGKPYSMEIVRLLDKRMQIKTHVRKFNLVSNCHYVVMWLLNSCIEQLIQDGVKELTLNFEYVHYVLPPTIFCSKNLTHLRLKSCFICDTNTMKNVCLPNLLELTLKIPNWSEEVLNNFIFNCPNLEVLDFSYIDGNPSICVSGLPKLTSLRLSGSSFTKVKIVAPSLRVLDLSIEGDKSDPEIACESTLNVLRLSGLRLTKKTLRNHVSKFLELEELVLRWLFVVSIDIPNKKIRKLEISSCGWLSNVAIDASSIEVLTCKQNVLPYYSMNLTSSLKKIHASFDMWPGMSLNWLEMKQLFLHLSQIKDMKLIFNYMFSQSVVVCEDLDESCFLKMLSDILKMVPSGSSFWCCSISTMYPKTYECMLNELFTKFSINSISFVSRGHQRHQRFMEVVDSMTSKENYEAYSCRYKSYKEWRSRWKHYERDVKFIRRKTCTDKIPNFFNSACKDKAKIEVPRSFNLSFDNSEYEITRYKLCP